MFSGLEELKRIPHALMVIDLKEESLAVQEARRRKIDVIALSNTDTDPLLATHLIPGNDNAKASISYVLGKIANAYKEGVLQKSLAPEVQSEATNQTGEPKQNNDTHHDQS